MRVSDTLGRILRNPDPEGNGGGTGTIDPPAGDQGQQSGADQKPWYSGLPEAASKDPEITKYKSPDEFYNGYRSKVEMLGRKGVALPKDDSPEEIERFYSGLGRPAKPEDYKFGKYENIHPSIENVEEIQKGLAPIFHKRGLRNEQADGLGQDFFELLSASAKNQEEQQQKVIQESDAALRKQWGANFENNKSLVGRVIAQTLSPEELKQIGGADGWGNNPLLLKAFHSVVSKLSEDTIKGLQARPMTGEGGGEGKEDAQKFIDEVEKKTDSDLYKAYWNENHPRHKEVVEKRMKMYGIVYGGNQ